MIIRQALMSTLCAATMVLNAGCKQGAAEAEAATIPPVTVAGSTVTFRSSPQGFRTAPVELADATPLALPGRLAWDEDRTVRIYTPFSGRVVRILVRTGDAVKVGEPLAELASADFGQAQAEGGKAAADLTLARQSVQRAEDLSRAGVVAQKDLEQARADSRRAEVEYERTQTRLHQVAAGSGRNFVLKAPIAGVIVDKTVNPGQELRADQSGPPIFLISDPQRLWVWLDAPESEISKLPQAASDTAFALTTAAYPNDKFTGRIVQNGEFIDPISRTFKLRGVVDNADRRLKAEMYVSVSLAARTDAPSPAMQSVPTTAIFLDGGHRYAFIKDSERQFSRVEVEVLREQVDRLIVAGIPTSAQVVTDGSLYLQQFLENAMPPRVDGATTADRSLTVAASRS